MERARRVYVVLLVSVLGRMLTMLFTCPPVRGVTLSDEEATRLNLSTLPVKNGHATVFGFNHNIHCIVCFIIDPSNIGALLAG